MNNVVAIAAGTYHSLALKNDGTVVGWGGTDFGEATAPLGLNNVMAISAGDGFSLALKNNGTIVAWGRNDFGETTVPAGIGDAKMISANGSHCLALVYSPLLNYPIKVSQDLLLIFNSASQNSVVLKDHYLAHRPMVSDANALAVSCDTAETYSNRQNFRDQILTPLINWLSANPTKRPEYYIIFLDIPTRIEDSNEPDPFSVALSLRTGTGGRQPFVNHIHLPLSDSIAYVNKLETIGNAYSPGKVVIRANAGGYANHKYVFDDAEAFYPGENPGGLARDAVIANGIPPASVIWSDSQHLATPSSPASDVAGYLTWGANGGQGGDYANDGTVVFTGSSTWYLIMTVESFNGRREIYQGNFIDWFSENAFGGSNHANTPVGAVSHLGEGGYDCINDPAKYFSLWVRGKYFAICAWQSDPCEAILQAVGDPFVAR